MQRELVLMHAHTTHRCTRVTDMYALKWSIRRLIRPSATATSPLNSTLGTTPMPRPFRAASSRGSHLMLLPVLGLAVEMMATANRPQVRPVRTGPR